MICVPCVAVFPEVGPLLPEILLAMLALAVAVPLPVCWGFGLSIKGLAVSSWRRLDQQERARLERQRRKLSSSIEIAQFLERAKPLPRLRGRR